MLSKLELSFLPAELLELVLDYLSVGDWVAIGAASKSFKSVVSGLKGTTMSSLADHSIYSNKALYERCLANASLCVEFEYLEADFSAYDDRQDLHQQKESDRLEELVATNNRVVFVKDVTKMVLYLQVEGLELPSPVSVKVVLASPGYDSLLCDSYMISEAAAHGLSEQLAKLLLNKSATVRWYVVLGMVRKPYSKTTGESLLECLKILLTDVRVDPSLNSNELIKLACVMGDLAAVKLLAEDPRVDVAADDNTPIIDAAGRAHASVVAYLIQDSRVDPADNSNAAINFLCQRLSVYKPAEQLETFSILLADPRVKPCIQNLFDAISGRNVGIVDLLLGDGRIVSSDTNNRVLKVAEGSGYCEIASAISNHPRFNPK